MIKVAYFLLLFLQKESWSPSTTVSADRWRPCGLSGWNSWFSWTYSPLILNLFSFVPTPEFLHCVPFAFLPVLLWDRQLVWLQLCTRMIGWNCFWGPLILPKTFFLPLASERYCAVSKWNLQAFLQQVSVPHQSSFRQNSSLPLFEFCFWDG